MPILNAKQLDFFSKVVRSIPIGTNEHYLFTSYVESMASNTLDKGRFVILIFVNCKYGGAVVDVINLWDSFHPRNRTSGEKLFDQVIDEMLEQRAFPNFVKAYYYAIINSNATAESFASSCAQFTKYNRKELVKLYNLMIAPTKSQR